jgi:hypothetical protein
MTSETLGAAPGWYPDGFGAMRFFDGTAWTAHTQPMPPATPVAAPAAPVAATTYAAATPSHSAEQDTPFYLQGWFLVDVAFLLLIVAIIVVAAT